MSSFVIVNIEIKSTDVVMNYTIVSKCILKHLWANVLQINQYHSVQV